MSKGLHGCRGEAPSGTDAILLGNACLLENACERRRPRGAIRPPSPRSTSAVDGRLDSLRRAFSLDCVALFLIIFCSVELSIAVHLGTLRGPVGWRASAAEMRNKSCPIVTFKQSVKVGLSCSLPVPSRSMRSGAGRMLPAGRPRLQHGKPQVNTLRLGSAMRDGADSRSWARNFPGRVSKLRHSCNRFR